MSNPIKDNRIVNDFTFALRFEHFLRNIEVNDLGSEEELEYLRYVANELVNYQVKTATDENEINYLKNNNKLCI